MTSKTRESNYIVDMVIWPKFGNSSTSMREVIITSMLQGFDQKNDFFEGWSWFEFYNLRLAQGMTLKFYTGLAKGLKTKSQKVFGASFYVCRNYREKLVEGAGTFWFPQSWIGLWSSRNWSLLYLGVLPSHIYTYIYIYIYICIYI